jgi:glycosyltransferase involved in cell wall biosynthesis
MNTGLVSICIPTFNGAQFLEEALLSIINQTYKNIEIIISDDGSSDDSIEIAENFKSESAFPVFIYNHSPSGIGANWNNCISKSNGEYVKFLFQDDLLIPDCIRTMVEIINKNKEIGMVACKRTIINENRRSKWALGWLSKYGDLQQKLNLPVGKINILGKEIFKHKEFCKDPYNKIGEPTALMFRKSIIDKTGLFRTDLHQILDLEFYYRVLKFYKIAIINENLVEFRLHPGQASQNKGIDYRKEYNLFRKILFVHFFRYLNTKEKIKLLKESVNWIRI